MPPWSVEAGRCSVVRLVTWVVLTCCALSSCLSPPQQLLRLLLVLLLVVAAATTLDGAKGEATGQVAFRRAQLTHHGKLGQAQQT